MGSVLAGLALLGVGRGVIVGETGCESLCLGSPVFPSFSPAS